MVPSGNMSSPTAGPPPQVPTSSSASSHHMVPSSMVGYTTTGRPSTHQQQPMSFTRALEISENLDQSSNARFMQRASNQPQSSQPQSSEALAATSSSASNKDTEDNRRDSVYDMNSYEISV